MPKEPAKDGSATIGAANDPVVLIDAVPTDGDT